jgi:hypothetical protein
MKLSAIRKPIFEATMISQNMSDFIEDTLVSIIETLNAGRHTWEQAKKYTGEFVYGGEVESNVKVTSKLPQLTRKDISVHLKVHDDIRHKNVEGSIYMAGGDKCKIIITVPIQCFDNGEKYIHNIREILTHEVVHAFDPKTFYGEREMAEREFTSKDDPRYKEYTTHISELDEFLESIAYTIASNAKGNYNNLLRILNDKDKLPRLLSPNNDINSLKKVRKRAIEIWQKYFSN